MTPLSSSWLQSLVSERDRVVLQLTNGTKLAYENVPDHVLRGLMTADSPGRVWRTLMRGKYGERKLA